MIDHEMEVPAIDEIEVDADTSAAIEKGIADAEAGRTVALDDVRKLIPQWISKYESRKPR